MKEVKEPEIKLFGRKIVLPDKGGTVAGGESTSGSGGDGCLEATKGEAHDEKQLHAQEDEEEEKCETTMQEKDQNVEEPRNPTVSSELDEDPKTPAADEDAASQADAALKKPDKILPCPRCNSMDTKFCYYNNYNIKQPRHFCKSCQRYWTAGGTMRNVPVGAGRRKNKNCRHISIPEEAGARVDAHAHHPALGPNGTVLSFGSDSPLCESNGITNGKDDCPISEGEPQLVIPNLNGVPYPIPCVPGVAWPIPWPLPGYPVPVYPAPFWNCSTPNAWNVPWLPLPTTSPTTNQKASISPLGKHSRNGELLKPNNSLGLQLSETKDLESSILVPKTLRIDDPKEAAKSSIWETLGIKYDSVSREGLFKALQAKANDKSASPVLQANPAALSRSINFQEGV